MAPCSSVVKDERELQASSLPAARSAGCSIRRFDYARDLKDLNEICAKVYGGTDYVPRIIHRIAVDPGVLVLAAAAGAAGPEAQDYVHDGEGGRRCQPGVQEPSHGPATTVEDGGFEGRVDGIVCGERRGSAVFIFGLRVREERRGSGLGRTLMAAVGTQSPQALATTRDATPPPPGLVTANGSHCSNGTSPPPAPGAQENGVGVGSGSGGESTSARTPINYIVTCTTSYNLPAQRIISRSLPGPSYQVEIWPATARMEAYEAEVGWVRGVGVPEGAPNMVDWMPGARAALDSDTVAVSLTQSWRRAANADELARAVSQLLHGGSCGGISGGLGSMPWLPMPYDIWPLDSEYVRRELAAGNIWMLTAPTGEAVQAAEVLAVMLLSPYATLNRVCAGVIARDNVATHAAVAHAATLHPHFWMCVLRNPTAITALLPSPSPTQHAAAPMTPPHTAAPPPAADMGAAAAADPAGAAVAGGTPTVEELIAALTPPGPLPALYDATGGFRDFWVYGGAVTST